MTKTKFSNMFEKKNVSVVMGGIKTAIGK